MRRAAAHVPSRSTFSGFRSPWANPLAWRRTSASTVARIAGRSSPAGRAPPASRRRAASEGASTSSRARNGVPSPSAPWSRSAGTVGGPTARSASPSRSSWARASATPRGARPSARRGRRPTRVRNRVPLRSRLGPAWRRPDSPAPARNHLPERAVRAGPRTRTQGAVPPLSVRMLGTASSRTPPWGCEPPPSHESWHSRTAEASRRLRAGLRTSVIHLEKKPGPLGVSRDSRGSRHGRRVAIGRSHTLERCVLVSNGAGGARKVALRPRRLPWPRDVTGGREVLSGFHGKGPNSPCGESSGASEAGRSEGYIAKGQPIPSASG